MDAQMKARGVDVPLKDLVPLHERKMNFRKNRGYQKILASVREIGLIEPLCVYRENGAYIILDGYMRYRACSELGVGTIPCLVFPDKEAYTFNRMVNPLSRTQEAQMLRKSLETIDESSIARTLGLKTIAARLNTHMLKRLHPEVIKAFDKGLLAQQCAMEFTHVKPERQAFIVQEMKRTGDYGRSFARALVFRTPKKQRERTRRRSPWEQNSAQKQELVKKLESVEKRYDFYTALYRQYTTDLLRLCIYVRKLLGNDKVRTYMESEAPEILRRFEGILFETQMGQPEVDK